MERIAIIGLGLIGGSLGLALRRAQVPGMEIVGFARRSEIALMAQSRGVVDRVEAKLGAAVGQADLVVIATPVMGIQDILEQIAEHLPAGCTVTDTGSTKARVMEWASSCLPQTVSFVGGHPMAGKETAGLGEADADLLRGCTYCLTPASNATQSAIELVVRMVELVGARPFFVAPLEHDNFVAAISHLPILLSAALVSTTTESDSWLKMSRLAASGYRDLSRLASGDPEMNWDICRTNGENIVYWIDRYIEELGDYRRLIAEDSEELMRKFSRSRQARERWLRQGKG